MSYLDSKEHRNISIDYIRIAMAYLGIILHAAFIILILHHTKAGVNDTSSLSIIILEVMATFIHSFRIEIFFILAGYFAGYQISNRSLGSYISNRLSRIAIPLIIIYFLFNLPVLLELIFASIHQANTIDHFSIASLMEISKSLVLNLRQLSYLWFLYFLLMYYLLTIFFLYSRRWLYSFSITLNHFYVRVMKKKFGVLVFCLLTTISTSHHFNIEFHLSSSWKPELSIFLFYYIFYLVGWFLFQTKSSIFLFQNGCVLYLMLGLSILPFIIHIEAAGPEFMLTNTNDSTLLSIVLYNLMAWFLSFSIIGLFTYCQKKHAWVIYLSQSSYWVYLSHFPILLFLTPILMSSISNIFLAFSVSITITTFIVLLSYHFLVRSTWVGILLNGRRY